jgi:hypothetical protein
VKIEPLRAALLGNAAFSATSGLLLVTEAGVIAALLGSPPLWLVQAVGVGLLLFAALVAWTGTRVNIDPAAVVAVSAADSMWVLGSVIGLALGHAVVPSAGQAAIAAVAIAVGAFGAAQIWALLRASRVGAGQYRHCIVVDTPESPDALWAALIDLGEIARHARSLRSSFLEPDPPAGLTAVRACEDRAGRRWREECRVSDEAREVHMRFVTEASDFPFPAATMSGGWAVEAVPNGSRARIWWVFRPRLAWSAPLVLAALAWQARVAMPHVVGSMAGAAGEPDGNADARRAWLVPVPC